MSNIQLARRAIRHYNSDMVSKSVNRHNQLAYIKAVRLLGTRWVLSKENQPQRKATSHESLEN